MKALTRAKKAAFQSCYKETYSKDRVRLKAGIEELKRKHQERLEAFKHILMKCSEKLVLQHIKHNIPASLDPYQFVYRANRSTEDTISTALRSVLTHPENNNTYSRMQCVDFSSTFNTIMKLSTLG